MHLHHRSGSRRKLPPVPGRKRSAPKPGAQAAIRPASSRDAAPGFHSFRRRRPGRRSTSSRRRGRRGQRRCLRHRRLRNAVQDHVVHDHGVRDIRAEVTTRPCVRPGSRRRRRSSSGRAVRPGRPVGGGHRQAGGRSRPASGPWRRPRRCRWVSRGAPNRAAQLRRSQRNSVSRSRASSVRNAWPTSSGASPPTAATAASAPAGAPPRETARGLRIALRLERERRDAAVAVTAKDMSRGRSARRRGRSPARRSSQPAQRSRGRSSAADARTAGEDQPEIGRRAPRARHRTASSSSTTAAGASLPRPLADHRRVRMLVKFGAFAYEFFDLPRRRRLHAHRPERSARRRPAHPGPRAGHYIEARRFHFDPPQLQSSVRSSAPTSPSATSVRPIR